MNCLLMYKTRRSHTVWRVAVSGKKVHPAAFCPRGGYCPRFLHIELESGDSSDTTSSCLYVSATDHVRDRSHAKYIHDISRFPTNLDMSRTSETTVRKKSRFKRNLDVVRTSTPSGAKSRRVHLFPARHNAYIVNSLPI